MTRRPVAQDAVFSPRAGLHSYRIGTFATLPDPSAAELLAGAFDVVAIDLEHSALTVRDAQAMTIAVQGAGAWALARVPSSASDLIAPLLDAGVDGIVAPMMESADQARDLVERLTFPPAGTRGYGPRRAGRYGRRSGYWAAPESRAACMVQIESPTGVQKAAEIAAVDGVDCLLIGTSDLSMALGTPHQLTEPAVRAAIAAVSDAAAARGVACALAAGGDPGVVSEVIDERCDLVMYSVDVRLYAAAADSAAERLIEAIDSMRSKVQASDA